MNRLLLPFALLSSTIALANAHHHSSGGSSRSTRLDTEGACLVWAPADGGVDGGGVDPAELAEAADAGHPNEVCAQHANAFGCSVAPGAPLLLVAALGLLRRRTS